MVSSELTPRELHPNCRSDRAAPIACGGLVTARTVAGREYHCPLCVSWRNRELPDIFSRYFFAYCLSAGHGVPLHTLMLITATKRMYLVNGYSVVKEPSRFRYKRKLGKRFLPSHPVADGKVRFWTLSQKFFNFFLKPVQTLVNDFLV